MLVKNSSAGYRSGRGASITEIHHETGEATSVFAHHYFPLEVQFSGALDDQAVDSVTVRYRRPGEVWTQMLCPETGPNTLLFQNPNLFFSIQFTSAPAFGAETIEQATVTVASGDLLVSTFAVELYETDFNTMLLATDDEIEVREVPYGHNFDWDWRSGVAKESGVCRGRFAELRTVFEPMLRFLAPVFWAVRFTATVYALGPMARANRLRSDRGIFHVTHRCHNRAFLLKFARDRDAYRTRLREHLARFRISPLDYCVTSNHVHLLMDTPEQSELGGFMQAVQGEFARAYNRRKERMNAFWGDNYHATLVESGEYLWSCLCYIELNMVRCGAVAHPRDCKWVGYHEIMGAWRRNRLLDLGQLCWRLGTASVEEVRKNLELSLAERIAKAQLKREPCWTESLAVGGVYFLEQLRPDISWRQETEIVVSSDNVWALRENPIPYGRRNGPEKCAIDVKAT